MELIMETVIKDNFQLDFDVKECIDDPSDYCSRFFAAMGMLMISRFGDDALKIGEKFKKEVENAKE